MVRIHRNDYLLDFVDGTGSKESTCQCRDIRDIGLIPGLRRSLEKEMTIHSSILAWTIPWAQEPGRLQSKGLQRVRHD